MSNVSTMIAGNRETPMRAFIEGVTHPLALDAVGSLLLFWPSRAVFG
jgi:hypothetical protein